jgi:hypothetical protein
MNIIIRDLDQTRVHFEAMVRRVGEEDATRAFNRALNSEGDKIRTGVRRALRHQTGAKAAIVARATKSYRSSFQNLVYTIEAHGDHMGLSHFSPRQFSYGVRAKPWGRWQRFEGTFLVPKLHHNVFVRETSARLPIRKIWGPSIPKEMLKDATERTFREAQPDVLAEAVRQLQLMLSLRA